eukprot:3498947-Pleurochrysis_carterae.AAC.2
MRSSRSSRHRGGDKDHSESVLTVPGTSGLSMSGEFEMLSPDDTQQPEAPAPETKDVGRTDAEEEAEVAGRKTAPNLDKMKEAGADLPLPEVYVRVARAVEDGTAMLILSPLASKG